MKFCGITPGDHWVFAGFEAQFQEPIANEFARRYGRKNPDGLIYIRHLNTGYTLPNDPRFVQAQQILEFEPAACVVSSIVLPPGGRLDDYKLLDAIFVDVRVHGRIVALRLGKDVQYLKPIDAKLTAWANCERDEVKGFA